jgi:Zn-finger protein
MKQVPAEVRCTLVFLPRWRYRSYSGGKYVGMSELTNIWRCSVCHCWSGSPATLLEQVCEKKERRRGKDRRAA